ncbi:hypothetical protein AAMO2058_001532500 [Amorphochlora amoebiformis]
MEAATQQLNSMGFNRALARRGLESTKVNGQIDVQRAAMWCINNAQASVPGPAVSSVDERKLKQVMDMGFSRAHAVKGLQLKKNNMQDAVLWCATNPDMETKGGSKPSSSKPKPKPKPKPKAKSKPASFGPESIVDNPERRKRRLEEYKMLEKEFLQEESKLSEKKKTYGGGRLGGKKKDAGGDEKVVDSPSKPKKEFDVTSAIRRKHESEKAKAALRQAEAQRKHEEKLKKERDVRRAKRQAAEAKFGDNIATALDYLSKNYSIERVRESLGIIAQIATRILKNPNEVKYRRIKLGKEKVQRTIVRPVGTMVIMKKLGFVEEEGEILVMKKVNPGVIKGQLAKMQRYLNRGATHIPGDLKLADAKSGPENVLFAAMQLRKMLSDIAELPGSVALRSLSTEKGTVFHQRFAGLHPLVEALKKLGYEQDHQRKYLRLNKPDVAFLRKAIADLDVEIERRKGETRVSRAVRSLLAKRGKDKTVYVVDKAKACLARIQRSPSEKRYWTLDLKRLLSSDEIVRDAKVLFQGIGFKVSGNTASWNGEDIGGLALAQEHLSDRWKAALLQLSAANSKKA